MPLLLRRAIGLAPRPRRTWPPRRPPWSGGHRAARHGGTGRAGGGGPFGRARRAHPAAGRAGHQGRRAAPPVPFTWFALGSLARREAVPSSDVDSALAWEGEQRRGGPGHSRAAGRGRGERGACGPAGCRPTHTARTRRTRCSPGPWRPGRPPSGASCEDPTKEKALILASLITDSRPVFSPVVDRRRVVAGLRPVSPGCSGCWPGSPCRSGRPPGSWRDFFAVEHSGEHRGQLDLKHGGLIPIVDLARSAGMAAGVTSGSTVDRLRAAEAAGTLQGSGGQDADRGVRLHLLAAARPSGRAAAARRGAGRLHRPQEAEPAGPLLPQGGVPRRGVGAGRPGRRAVTGGPVEPSSAPRRCADDLGQDGLGRGEIEPEGARPAVAAGGPVDDGHVGALGD